MGRYSTTDIKIEGSRTKKYRDILHTIIINKMKEIKKTNELIPLENGDLYYNFKNTLQGGKIVKYSSGKKYICEFKYNFKKNNQSWYFKKFVTYDEYQSYLREESINQILDKPSLIISSKPKLEIPYKVEVDDELFYLDFHRNEIEIEVIKVTPRTFVWKHSLSSVYGRNKYVSRIVKGIGGVPIWSNRGRKIYN